MKMLRVTAIVPTYNRPVLLERALRSIAAQKLVPAEIIVVDDGGSGHEVVTRDTLRRCGFSDVTVAANASGKGASGSRNTGAVLAAEELLAFLDDDDEWLPSYLAEALREFELKNLDVIGTDLLCQFDDGIDRPSKAAPDQLRAELFLTRNPGLSGSNIIIKRSLYREIGGFDETLPACNDIDFALRLSLRERVNYGRVSKRLVRYHQHSGPKLGTVRGESMRAGVRRFYELHAHRMTAAQKEEFRSGARAWWGIDEKGDILDLPRSAFYESLLPVIKARLDQQKRG
jgi:glycosyltransferase involved in cell wall biosynthesis